MQNPFPSLGRSTKRPRDPPTGQQAAANVKASGSFFPQIAQGALTSRLIGLQNLPTPQEVVEGVTLNGGMLSFVKSLTATGVAQDIADASRMQGLIISDSEGNQGRPVQAQGTPLPTKFFFEVNRATAEGKNLFLITPIVPDERIYLDSTAKSPGITIYIFTSQLDLEQATAGLEAVYNIEILRYNLAHSTEHRAAMVSKLLNNAKKGRIMFCVVEEALHYSKNNQSELWNVLKKLERLSLIHRIYVQNFQQIENIYDPKLKLAFKNIGEVANQLPKVPITAVSSFPTASAVRLFQNAVERAAFIRFQQPLNLPNTTYEIIHDLSTEDVRKHIFEGLKGMRQERKRGIIYCKTDKEQVTMFKSLAFNHINYFADASKPSELEKWKDGKLSFLVASSDFKYTELLVNDCNVTIHASIPQGIYGFNQDTLMIGRNSEPSLIRIYYSDEEFYRCAKIPKLLLAPIIETARAIRPRHLCIRKRLAESKLDGTNLKRVLICCTSCTYGLSRRIEDIMPVLKMIQTILEYQRVNSKPNKENPVVGPTNCDILPIELGQTLGGSKSKDLKSKKFDEIPGFAAFPKKSAVPRKLYSIEELYSIIDWLMLETILGLVQKIGSQKIILYVCKGSKFNAIISDRELQYPLPPLLPDRPYARPGVGGLTFPVGAFQNGHFNISTGFIG